MSEYQTLNLTKQSGVATIQLNRPEIHNAFDDRMIAELTQIFVDVLASPDIRVLVITGVGKSFCAGADMNWMRRMKSYSLAENREDATKLSEMLERLYSLPIPTIAQVNGAAVGGGVGLVSACDIAIASETAVFSLSEVKLGLVPACISPYLLRRMPAGKLRPYFLSGIRISAEKAKELGLIYEVVPEKDLSATVTSLVENLLQCGPKAIKMAKELLDQIPGMDAAQYMPYTAEMIANLRIGDEGQEGLTAFLDKRKPKWQTSGK